MSFLSSLDAHSRASNAADKFDRFRLILDATNAVSFERGPAQLVMARALSDEPSRLMMTETRRTTDEQLASSEAALRAGGPENETFLKGIVALRGRLAVGRRLVDALGERELRDRSAASVKEAIQAMFAAFDSAEQVRDQLGHTVVRLAPEIASEVFLGLISSGLREHAGRLGAYVVMTLKSGSKVDPDSAHDLIVTIGRLEMLHRAILSLTATMAPDVELKAAIDEVEHRFFGVALPQAIAIARAAGQEGAASVTEFTAGYRGELRPSQELRETAMRISVRKLDQMRAAAFTKVLLSGTLMLVVVLTMLMVAVIFRRSLFEPLLAARAQVIAIADGDLSAPTAAPNVSREIGEMLAGLDTLREDQRYRRQLEEDQRRMAQQLKLLSETDMLTGLLNRRALENTAAQAFGEAAAGGHAIGLILFDIDHFKDINDTFGHSVGDAVLQAIASELRSALRPCDAFARFGGEEFLVLLPKCELADARHVASELRRRLGEIALGSAPGLRITASFGVAVSEPGAKTGLESLLGTADRRLYAAKRAGRDRVFADDRWDIAVDAA